MIIAVVLLVYLFFQIKGATKVMSDDTFQSRSDDFGSGSGGLMREVRINVPVVYLETLLFIQLLTS